MKKLTLLSVFISLFSISMFSQPTDYIGYWSFSGSCDDISGNNYNGTAFEATLTADKNGTAESAYHFDGYNDCISLPNSFATVLDGDFSFSVWFRCDGENLDDRTYQDIIDFRGERSIWLEADESLKKGVINFTINNIKYTATTAQTFDYNAWNQIVVVRSNNIVKIFMNNIEGGNMTISNAQVASGENRIGKLYSNSYGGSGYRGSFNGAIDEVMIFSRALTSQEIQALYEATGAVVIESNPWQQNTDNIYYDGKVAIGGSTLPDGYDFSVNGKIVTKEIQVDLDNWPDFVFNHDYKLMPIKDLESYVNKNEHLPSIPSEKEVKENGVSLGDINAKLLQKVEELTLYTIKQDKQLTEQDQKNKKLEEVIDKQQKDLDAKDEAINELLKRMDILEAQMKQLK